MRKDSIAEDLAFWMSQGEIIERDGRGPKVIQLPENRFLKIFYTRSWLSTSTLRSRATQFARNAHGLLKRGVSTVEVEQLFRLPNPQRHCVLYQGIPGLTVRQQLLSGQSRERVSDQLGRFVAELHDLGVMFRSLHLSNIIAQPDGRLGLIDIADMRFNLIHLSRRQRLRNFSHILRYQMDKTILDLSIFSTSYVEQSRQRFFPVASLLKQLQAIHPKVN